MDWTFCPKFYKIDGDIATTSGGVNFFKGKLHE